MKSTKLFLFLFLPALLLQTGCRQGEKVLYDSAHFRVLNDRVEQGKFTAKAVSCSEMTSNYQSNSYFSSVFQFKFSINGKDNELGYNINHEANIFAQNDQGVVVDVVFGKRLELGKGKDRWKGKREVEFHPLPTKIESCFRWFCRELPDHLYHWEERQNPRFQLSYVEFPLHTLMVRST